MRFTAKQTYIALCCVVVLCFAALLACTYAANMFLHQKSRAVHDSRLKAMVLERTESRLNRAKADIAKYRDLSEIARDIVPQDKDQAQTVLEISNLADKNHVVLGSITFPTSSLGAVGAATDAQLTAVPNIPGTFLLPITVSSDSQATSQFSNLLNFLRDLERNRRTALVSGIQLTPDPNNPGRVSFTLTVREYIKP